MNQRIIVMGGSFNPPTIAHFRLMKAALDSLEAHKGVFVPVSYAYLKRKMSHSGSSICLSESLRLEMLHAMCADDPRMCASDMEFGTTACRTYETMAQLQKQFPDGKLYFLCGADKLDMIAQWAEYSVFLDRFHIVIFGREGASPMELILAVPALAQFADRFAVVQQPESIGAVSSTAVRNAMVSGGNTEHLLHPAVARLLSGVDMSQFREEIIHFKGEYAFLSNLYPAEIEWEGILYPCVEAAFQASRLEDPKERRRFVRCAPDQLKAKGSQCRPRAGWEENKLSLMKELLLLKFRSHPELARELKNTGNRLLIYGTNGKDSYWGTSRYTWDGENHLGKLLMEVRDEL